MKHLSPVLRMFLVIGAIEVTVRALLGLVVFAIVVTTTIALLAAAYGFLVWQFRRRS